MAEPRKYTDEQILEAINQAIRDRELDVIPSLLKVLALQAPEKAQAAMDLMKAGLDISRRQRSG